MSDALDLEPDPYHDLSAMQRDHLLAAALYAAKRGQMPTTAATRRTVGNLTGSEPHDLTTASALNDLADMGLVERVDGEPDARGIGVRVTDAGERALARGAARLDAAATVEGDV